MQVTIDKNSGYCFGVEFAIKMAEDEMENQEKLYCLGDIVHNDMEVKRLREKGLVVIDRDKLQELSNCKVLIRAHGEPPETYKLAIENNIELIDASCPVVLKLQHRVKNAFDKMERENGQIVIFGKKGHAEVIGLTGQTLEKAIVVMEDADLEKIDYQRPVTLFSQTTKSTKGFYALSEKIEKRIKETKGELNELDFNSGERVFIPSDGLTELAIGEGMMFGSRRILKLMERSKKLDVSSALNLFVEEADKYIKNFPQGDDITLLFIDQK